MREEARTREETVYIGECPECKKEQVSRYKFEVDVRCSPCHIKYSNALTVNDLTGCTIKDIKFDLKGDMIEIIVVDDDLEYSVSTNNYTALVYS